MIVKADLDRMEESQVRWFPPSRSEVNRRNKYADSFIGKVLFSSSSSLLFYEQASVDW